MYFVFSVIIYGVIIIINIFTRKKTPARRGEAPLRERSEQRGRRRNA
jgi:hypothetical protein